MQTFSAEKPLVANPDFARHKAEAMRGLDMAQLDEPVHGLARRLCSLPWCFTLQCCWGHFVPPGQADTHTLSPVDPGAPETSYRYRIAYVALCLDACDAGRSFLDRMRALPADLGDDRIQFGCAEWFWERQANSYVLQVQPPDRAGMDAMEVSGAEAIRLQATRERMFARLEALVNTVGCA